MSIGTDYINKNICNQFPKSTEGSVRRGLVIPVSVESAREDVSSVDIYREPRIFSILGFRPDGFALPDLKARLNAAKLLILLTSRFRDDLEPSRIYRSVAFELHPDRMVKDEHPRVTKDKADLVRMLNNGHVYDHKSKKFKIDISTGVPRLRTGFLDAFVNSDDIVDRVIANGMQPRKARRYYSYGSEWYFENYLIQRGVGPAFVRGAMIQAVDATDAALDREVMGDLRDFDSGPSFLRFPTEVEKQGAISEIECILGSVGFAQEALNSKISN